MGRQGVDVNVEPTAAATAQSSSSMPPVPPKHPKKRWVRLMESRPAPVQLLESAEVTGAPPSVVSRVAAAAGVALCSDVRRVPATPAGTAGSPRYMSGRHSGTSATYSGGRIPAFGARQHEDKPLNLSTGPSAEVQLSRIVDRVVERMLKSGDMDSVRAGDPLRFWFTSQFENKQRGSESSSTASSPGPPPPPSAADPQVVASPTPIDGRAGAEPVASSRMMELTIGMSDTINRVIETVYRQELAAARSGCEVTSNSSDCVNSTSSQDCSVSSASVPLSSLSSLVAPALKRRQVLSLVRPPAATSSPSSVASSRGSAAARRPLPATIASPPDSAAAAVTMGPPEASRLDDTATVSVIRVGEETSALPSAVRSPNRRSRKNPPQYNTTTDGPKESYMEARTVSRKRKAGKQGINRIQKAQATAVASNGIDSCESELETHLSPAIQDKSQLPDQTATS